MGNDKKRNASLRHEFCIFYEGSDYDDHEMDIRELGNAMIALSEMITSANISLNSNSESDSIDPIEVKVKADFKPGSFGFLVDVLQYGVDSKDVMFALGIGTSFVFGGVLEAISWLKGEQIGVIQSENDGLTKLVNENGDTLQVPSDSVELLNSPTVRRSIENLIYKPLKKEGTSRFLIKDPEDLEVTFEIDKANVDLYKAPPVKELLDEKVEILEKETVIIFIQANIHKASGWKMIISGDPETHAVKMADESFLERIVNREEAYLLSNPFNVLLQTKIVRRNHSPNKKTYAVLKVNHESNQSEF